MKPHGLIFSQFPVLPADQGNRARLLWSCKEFLARGFELDFLYYPRESGGDFEYKDLQLHANFFRFVFVYTAEHPFPVYSRKHLTSSDVWTKELRAFVEPILRKMKYAFVYVNYTIYGEMFDLCSRGELRVLDTHDRLGERRDEVEQMGMKPDFFSLSLKDEAYLAGKADLLLAIKPSDAEYYSRLTGKPTITMGVPVIPRDSQNFNVAPVLQKGKITFGFIGSVNAVNKAAVTALYELLSARLKSRQRPALQIYICGKINNEVAVPHELLVQGVIRQSIFVRELEEFYDNCDVILVPTIRSTGLKIKSVEALSYGKPIIATADGFDGVGSEFLEHNCAGTSELLDYVDDVLEGRLAISLMSERTSKVAANYSYAYELGASALCAICDTVNVHLEISDHQSWERMAPIVFSMILFLERYCAVTVIYSHEDLLHKVVAQLDAMNVVVYEQASINSEKRDCDLFVTSRSISENPSPTSICLQACGTNVVVYSSAGRDRRCIFPLDMREHNYWGPRVRLVVWVCGRDSNTSIDKFFANWTLGTLQANFNEVLLVSNFDLKGYAGLKFVRPTDYLFSKWPGSKSFLVVLNDAVTNLDAAYMIAAMSMPNNHYFCATRQSVLIAKTIAGADVHVRYSSSPPQLAIWACQAINLIRTKPSTKSHYRFRPNRGAMTQIISLVRSSKTRRIASD